MTYNPNAPNPSQSPGVFPTQNNTNFARLKTIISGDHVFNDTAQASDGIHKQVTLLARADPITLTAGNGILYNKLVSGASQLFYYNGISIQQITPLLPIVRAAVNFNGTGSNGSQTIRSQFNVTSVVKTATGSYTINFTTNMPNTNYIVQVTGMRDSSGDVSSGCVSGNATYTTSVAVGSVKVQFFGASTSTQDVIMGNILILSVV